jgi:hypothetical protein
MLLNVHRRGHVNTGPNGVYTVEYEVNITANSPHVNRTIEMGRWTVSLTGRGVVRVQGPTRHTSKNPYGVDRQTGYGYNVTYEIRERVTSELELRFLRDLHHESYWVIHGHSEYERWSDDDHTTYFNYGSPVELEQYLRDPNPSMIGGEVR